MHPWRSLVLQALFTLIALTGAAAWQDPPEGVITLRDALTAALADNPQLAAAALTVQANDGRVRQAGLLPNPELKLEVENIGGSGNQQSFESAEATLRLSQLIELGGKRGSRRALATLERDGAQWDYEVRRAELAAATARAFVAVLALQERVALADDLVRVAGESARAVAAQVEVGAAAPVQAATARVTAGAAGLQRLQRTRELASARRALAAHWGSPDARFARVGGTLDEISPPPDSSALLAEIDRNPDLARWSTELAARQAGLELEHARAVPNVIVGAGPRYFSDNDDTALVLELWVPLPIFDRNQGAIDEAAARIAAAGAEQRASALAVRAAVGAAYDALRTAYEQATALRDDIIPEAQRAAADAAVAYGRGGLRADEVFDAQRLQFQLREQYVEALAEYHLARIDLDRLTGGVSASEGGH